MPECISVLEWELRRWFRRFRWRRRILILMPTRTDTIMLIRGMCHMLTHTLGHQSVLDSGLGATIIIGHRSTTTLATDEDSMRAVLMEGTGGKRLVSA